ncbi:Asp-tRNA(Asn)/Glu-tRNA(Gln) amidotransferase subunit GatC [Candidatus Babeliales bacterium]|nr:Asp-tRNA(Asn)/Glu-tRNA(Gln) amidotransferase subunit GatC [Candidatus Babeliales bacterium]
MKINRDEVIKLGVIARIALKDDEIDGLVRQLQDVLDYAECVKTVAGETDDQPSNKNVNFFREDVVIPTHSEVILQRSPEREENYFVVPKILDSK